MANKMDDNAAAFEALQAKQNGAADGDDDVVVDNPPDAKDDKAEKGEKTPPGFLSYDEYVKSGKDPDRYKGKKAYEDDYQRIQEIKGLKKEFKQFTQQVLSANEQTLNKERERMKSELEEKFKQQKDEGDVDGALKTKEQLTELKQEIKQGPAPLNPVVQEIIEANPILDKNSDEYNKEFFEDMARFQGKELQSLSMFPPGDPRFGSDLSDAQVRKVTVRAFEKAKELNAELFKPDVSERNNRQGLGRNGGKGGGEGKGQSFEVRLKNLKMDNNRSPDLNPNPAYDMYKHIKEKYGDKAADKFARSALSEE